jgi:hypothetical protein
MTQSMVQEFNFVDFEPSAGVVKRSMEKLHRIFGESPSDSSTRAILRKTRAGFEGSLQVRSAVGSFVANVAGEDPIEVLDNLSQNVRSQLQTWKKKRLIIQDLP